MSVQRISLEVCSRRTAFWKRRMRAIVFGGTPSCSRNCTARCLRLQPASSARLAMLILPPVASSRDQARETSADGSRRFTDPRFDQRLDEVEARLPRRRVIDLRHRPLRYWTEDVRQLDGAVGQLDERRAEE